MSLDIRYLPRDPYTIRMVTHWLYCEWGWSLPGNSLEWAVERFTRRAESRVLPLCLVAFHNGEPVGTASLVRNEISALRNLTPWVGGVYVRPHWRSTGVGSALLARLQSEWTRLGYPTAYLYTPDCVNFYRRMGWHIAEWRDYLEERVAVMRWENKPSLDWSAENRSQSGHAAYAPHGRVAETSLFGGRLPIEAGG